MSKQIPVLVTTKTTHTMTCPECGESFLMDSHTPFSDLQCPDCKRAWEEADEKEMERRKGEEL